MGANPSLADPQYGVSLTQRHREFEPLTREDIYYQQNSPHSPGTMVGGLEDDKLGDDESESFGF